MPQSKALRRKGSSHGGGLSKVDHRPWRPEKGPSDNVVFKVGVWTVHGRGPESGAESDVVGPDPIQWIRALLVLSVRQGSALESMSIRLGRGPQSFQSGALGWHRGGKGQ